MVLKSTKKNYPQKFRSSWLTDPQLNQWLRSENVLVQDGSIEKRPKCIYCNQLLCVRYKDLIKHSSTSKHLKNCAQRPHRVKENLIVSDANDTDDNNKTEEENDEDYDEQEIQLEESVDEGKKKTTAIEISYTPAPSSSVPVFSTQRKLHLSNEGEISTVDGDSEMISPANTTTTMVVSSYQDEMERLKVERMKIELEQEKVKLYVLKLDVLKKEKELGLPRSAITIDM